MSHQVFRVDDAAEFQRAGPTDLIELLPVEGTNALFIPKEKLEILVASIVLGAFAHISGPTGSAKTSLIEALHFVPRNFECICTGLGFEPKPLRLYPVEMATFESPGELFYRRALRDGCTYDEDSTLVRALLEASASTDDVRHLVWVREIGRVHSASVQGGLLDLMSKGRVVLPDGRVVDTRGVAWVADSNYQAEGDAVHTLVTFDDAVRRRFDVNLTVGYLSAEQEAEVLRRLMAEGEVATVDDEVLVKVVRLGQAVRLHRSEGSLQSVPPPTIYGYLALLRLLTALPHLSLQQVARATLLGNASPDDQKLVSGVFNEVFGLQGEQDDDPTSGGGLF
ncbi:MAG: hypothetical protein ISS72_00915 [Candidatus Brocadiae bacterium]|nr:hypothetical protein [Candidatus Brocadiia bacterium]